MIKIVSFDLDGTLIKNTYADKVWLEGLPKIFAQEKKISFENALQYLQNEYDKIGDNKVEWYDIEFWFHQYQLQYSWKKLLENYKKYIDTYPEVLDVLKRLYKKYTLIIISNAKREFIKIELKETNIRKYFSNVFSSISDFHKVKKVTDFYSMICDKLEVNPNEIIHIGDNMEFDYTIPKNLGIISFYLDRNRINTGDFIVYNLKDLEKKLVQYNKSFNIK